ncbi:hypothetical protein BJY04DRAFT_215642 [Aspergillus karnatakaensis]|uniref:uncharacterized protein n=1 Tax=Aspergillus karnatakaensis TaxID=1810916 RepID=UPI003CCCEDD2
MPPLTVITLYTISLLTLILTSLPLSYAQIGFNAQTSHFVCPAPEKHYCASPSLQGSSIISCYEPTPHAGTALCAFNGTGYTHSGLEIPVPETTLCDGIPFPHLGLSRYDKNREDGYRLAGPARDTPLGGPSIDGVSSLAALTRGSTFISTTAGYLESFITATTTITMTTTMTDSLPSSSRESNDKGNPSITCSNPWVNIDSKKNDVLTLDIVLVVPTSGISSAIMSMSTASSPLIGGDSLPTACASSGIATALTTTTSTVPLGSNLSSDGDEVIETGFVSGGMRLSPGERLFTALLDTLLLQAWVYFLFF